MNPDSGQPRSAESPEEGVAALGAVAGSRSPSIGAAVEAAREFLGFDVAYATEMTDDEQFFRTLRGDGESFGVAEGIVMPARETYCQKVLDGELPNVIPVVADEPDAACLPVTDAADVGAFISVPLHFSDGVFFGTLCAASHDRRPDIGDQELQFLRVFARIIADHFERETLEERSRILEMEATAVETLVAAVGARDSYTAEHSHDVVEFALGVGRRLGLDGQDLEDVKLVALLHDIGKLATPDAILQKPAPLTDDEWVVMREHPAEAEKLIAGSPVLSRLAPMIRAEHERWDGGGYPDGLAGEDIPLPSRITLACDAYSAMITDRPYRRAMDPAAARAELEANAGTQFDPGVVALLLEELLDP